MIANEAHRQKKKNRGRGGKMEGMFPIETCPSVAGWLIDDPVAMLTDQYEGAFYSTVQLK